MIGAAAGLAAGLLTARAGLWLMERAQLFRPRAKLEEDPAARGLAFENVDFVSEDNARLHGWWLPCADARGAAILCHGNGGNIGDRVATCASLLDLRVHVFAFDYRGYGRSRGLPREAALYRDARAAFEVVRARYDDADNVPVIAIGLSLGAAVAVQLAIDRPVRGVVLEGAFTSVADMAARRLGPGPWRWLIDAKFDTRENARRLRTPALVAHARDDDVVPYEMGRAVFDALGGPKRFVESAGGHDEAGWMRVASYRRDLERFLDATLGPGQKTPERQ